jgi:hypothetical protein
VPTNSRPNLFTNSSNGANSPMLPLPEAAVALGISRDALRMRLARGRQAGERVGGVWYVHVSPEQRVEQPHEQPEPVREQPEQPGEPQFTAADLVAQLRADVAYLQGALEREQIAHGETRQLLLAEQTRRLPMPVDTVATQPETATSAPVGAEPSQTPLRPWWAVWRR